MVPEEGSVNWEDGIAYQQEVVFRHDKDWEMAILSRRSYFKTWQENRNGREKSY